MKVLMFGWEFPPLISGGLGTACFGITRGLIDSGVDVTFVLPASKGRTNSGGVHLIGADSIPLTGSDIQSLHEFKNRLKIITAETRVQISPYYTSAVHSESELFFMRKNYNTESGVHSILDFTGNYGKNLMYEVMKYGIIGSYLGYFHDCDIIHAHDWLTFPAGVAAKNASGKPLVVHVHATEYDRSGEHMNNEVYNIEKYGMENADLIIAVSHYTKSIIMQHYGIAADKIRVVHNAVNKQKQIERYGITKNLKEKIVLFLGRVTMQKGPDYFIEAANLVLQKIPNVRFVMAGSGDMLPRMISRMAQLRISDRFHFTGFLHGTDVERMYALSDVYVMPSVSEPFGISPFEALLYDIPIIISRQSGVAEILKSALLIDFWDIQKLAESIIKTLEDESFSRMIVERCQESIKHIEWNNAGREIRQIYSNLLSK